MTTENPTPPTITYWFHPESDSFWIDDGTKPLPELGDDSMSIELDEYEFVKRQIEAIDRDDAHKLPEGIKAVIKLAEIRGQNISGMIWYDRDIRFTNGFPVNLFGIEKEPGGVYTTSSGNKYLVETIITRGDNG